MTDGPEYLRARDIVALTGMSIRTVRRRIADQTIPSTKLGGRFVAKADLERLLSPSTDLTEGGTEEYDGIQANGTVSGKHS